MLVRSRRLEANPDEVSQRVLDEIVLPLFVKPANQGSSVGIHKVSEPAQLLPALRDAARYDTKILCEQGIDAREIEVAVLGIDPIEASVPGEIRTDREFYDYEAKYVDEETELLVPAPLDDEQTREVRKLAVDAMTALEGEGMGRVDFLLERTTGDFYINEVNSLPGFTKVSMYPRLWEASGLPYPALLDRLIELAMERHQERSQLETADRRSLT
jgi:D-alanine-D-alanine ligase